MSIAKVLPPVLLQKTVRSGAGMPTGAELELAFRECLPSQQVGQSPMSRTVLYLECGDSLLECPQT